MLSYKLTLRGLVTNPNDFSETPEGALVLANNVVIDRPSIAESRRGFKQYYSAPSTVNELIEFNGELYLHRSDTLYVDDGSWTSLGNLYPNTSGIYSAEGNRNCYFTSARGVLKLNNGALEQAGVPAPLDVQAAVNGASGFLANGETVAYRILFGKIDANNNLILGAPSTRVVITNSAGGDRNVELTFSLPSLITDAHFYQIYRSEISDVPSDELQLVKQGEISSGDVTAGYITVVDNTVDDDKGAYLYTNPTQEGILQSNYPPPSAKDIANFAQHMFYANTTRPHQATVTLNENFSLNDTITIGGVTYTAKAVESIVSAEFAIGTNVSDTMRSLLKIINRHASSVVEASEFTPNTFLVERPSVHESSFTITASSSTPFAQALPISSVQRVKKNGLSISKPSQPEHVPLLNEITVGDDNKEILRIFPLREALIVIKEDGIFAVFGTDTTNFSVNVIDNTLTCFAPRAAASIGNQVICATNIGIASASASDVINISKNIENTVLPIIISSAFNSYAYAVAYESDKKYILSMPSTTADTQNRQHLVFNVQTGAWTTWLLRTNAGVVVGDKLYLSRVTDNEILQERKSLTASDYCDDEYDVNILSSSGTSVVLSDASNVSVGMTLKQNTVKSKITAIDGVTITVADSLSWSNGAAKAYAPIPVSLTWSLFDQRSPSIIKHWREVTVLFDNATFSEAQCGVSSSLSPGYALTNLLTRSGGAWGTFAWGGLPWGGASGGEQLLRTFFPLEKCRAPWVNIRLSVEEAFTSFTLSGAGVLANITSQKVRS